MLSSSAEDVSSERTGAEVIDLDGTVAQSSANGLVDIRFTSRYHLQIRHLPTVNVGFLKAIE